MIDLHCHILHGVDDGPETAAESLRMARTFERAGYRTVAATPHMVPGTAWMPAVDRINAGVAELNRAIRDQGLDLDVVPGMEIALDPQLPRMLDDGRLLTLGNASCLLIEPPFQQLPPGWEQIIFAIQAKGYSILLAHPERCLQLATDPGLVDRLTGSGVYLQVSWGSFLGQYGRAVKRAARHLVRNGRAHCLATDSHHPDGHTPQRIRTASARLGDIIGPENVHRLSTDNPQRVLNGEPLQPMKPSEATTGRKIRRWWRLW
jgi:protein-tyrosine phosphatase